MCRVKSVDEAVLVGDDENVNVGTGHVDHMMVNKIPS